MAYFNQPLYSSFLGKPAPQPAKPLVYCDACGRDHIPMPREGPTGRGSRHWGTGFKWAPRYGKPCDACGAEC